MKIASLFAGCGGLDLGLKNAGHELVYAHDIDKDCVDTYRNYFGDHIVHGDIKELYGESLPKIDLVTGGFPCQGFSIANIHRSKEDERNELYIHLCRIIREALPTFFLAENVPGILNLAGGEVAKIIDAEFESIGKNQGHPGYDVKRTLLNAVNYNVPQNRKRVLWIGISNEIEEEKRELFWDNFPPPKQRGVEPGYEKLLTIKDAIDDLPEPSAKGAEVILNHDYTKHKVKINGYMGNRKMPWDKPSPTIVGRGGGTGGPVIPVHPNEHRRLSVRETARIQTFPDDFEFFGSVSSQYRQIGNAVAVNFAKALGKVFKKFEDGKLEVKSTFQKELNI